MNAEAIKEKTALNIGRFSAKQPCFFDNVVENITLKLTFPSFPCIKLFVGQQLQALKKPYEEPFLFYWQREARGSAAEVDYLWQSGEQILPIEVKAGKTGTLKSLRLFLSEKEAPFGIRFSLHPLSFTDSVLSIPLYCIEGMTGLVDQIISSNSID